jgi:hypothetical protein
LVLAYFFDGMLLFFNCHLLLSVLCSHNFASISSSPHRPAFLTRIQISHPDFDRGFLIWSDPDFRASFLTRISYPDFRISGFPTQISDPDF